MGICSQKVATLNEFEEIAKRELIININRPEDLYVIKKMKEEVRKLTITIEYCANNFSLKCFRSKTIKNEGAIDIAKAIAGQ